MGTSSGCPCSLDQRAHGTSPQLQYTGNRERRKQNLRISWRSRCRKIHGPFEPPALVVNFPHSPARNNLGLFEARPGFRYFEELALLHATALVLSDVRTPPLDRL